MSHSFFNDSNNSNLDKCKITESSTTGTKIKIVSVEKVDVLTAKLNGSKYCELYSNSSIERCDKNDSLPLKKTNSQKVNQMITFDESSNLHHSANLV